MCKQPSSQTVLDFESALSYIFGQVSEDHSLAHDGSIMRHSRTKGVSMRGFMSRLTAYALVFAIHAAIVHAGDSKTPSAPKAGFRAEVLGQLDQIEQKIEDLAEAVPAEKYSWRPGEGVRSISEVYVHIAGSNYFFMTFLGFKSPVKMEPNMEKSVTDKGEITKMLKPSFDHVRNAILKLKDKDLERTTEMFGNTVTYRNAIITALAHLHEHLGQSIAYARMNGVVPPWTAAEQAAATKKNSK
jgi:uncharacterized damage-inducible protein DinB